MGKIGIFKPSFKKTSDTFNPKTFDPVRERDQKLHKTEEWKRFSVKYLKLNPECYVCGEKSEVSDHVEPSKARIEVFERDGNFLPLCQVCHNLVTAKFDYKFRIGSSNFPKIKWMNEERARNEILKDRVFIKPKFMRYRDK